MIDLLFLYVFEEKHIFKTVHDRTLSCRADLIQYLLDLGRIYIGKPGIKIDKDLTNIFDAFDIPIPDNHGNHQIIRMLKKDGIFDDIKHYTDCEYSSVNTLFHTLDGFYMFVEKFSDWLEKNDKTEPRPDVVVMED